MKSNNYLDKKENLVSIVVTLLFILGFLILSNYNQSSAGFITLEELGLNETINDAFEIQPINETFKTQASGDQVVKIWWPENNTNQSTTSINFTFNVSDSDDNTDNCTLFLNIDGAGYDTNTTTIIGTEWINISDGFNATFAGASPYLIGITTNGSDFWVLDYMDEWIYHLDANGNNMSDGLNTTFAGPSSELYTLTTNSSDFWVVSQSDDWIYHLDANGNNMSDGFNATFAGSSPNLYGITTNGSDFWIFDANDKWIYHLDAIGNNMSDGFDILQFTGGSSDIMDMTTNGSDFWIINFGGDKVIYHVDANGNSLSDPLSFSFTGASSTWGLTTPSFIMAENGGGIPNEFWITETSDDWIYHIKKQVTEDINQTINKTFDNSDHTIQWKVGCYDDNSIQVNSSAYNVTLDQTAPVVNIYFPFNNTNHSTPYINFTFNTTDTFLQIDSCVLWLNKQNSWQLNFTDITIAETINQTINLTVDSQNMLWLVECNDTLNNKANSTTYNLTIDTTGPIVNLQAPEDNLNTYARHINFTYNVSDTYFDVKNCTLFLNIDSAGYSINTTHDTSITEAINQSINKTFDSLSHTVLWKVGCYDNLDNQADSSIFTLNLNQPQTVSLISPTHNLRTIDEVQIFTYNVSDPDNTITNCTLFTNTNETGYVNTSTETTIIKDIDQEFPQTIDTLNSYVINWKVGCYSDDHKQVNSSEFILITSLTIPSYLQSAPSGGGGGKAAAKPLVNQQVTQPTYLLLQAPKAEERQQYIIQRIDLNKMNLDPAFQALLGEAIVEIDIGDMPAESVVGTIGETLTISIGKQSKINVDYSGDVPSLFFKSEISEGKIKPPMKSAIKEDLKRLLLISIIFGLIFLIYKYYPKFKDKIPIRVHLPKVKSYIHSITSRIFIIAGLFRDLPKLPQKIKAYRKQPEIIEPSKIKLPQETLITSNAKIIEFYELYNLTKYNLSKNYLKKARKNYEDLHSLYTQLIIKINTKEQDEIYTLMQQIYTALNNSIEIKQMKKLLKQK